MTVMHRTSYSGTVHHAFSVQYQASCFFMAAERAVVRGLAVAPWLS